MQDIDLRCWATPREAEVCCHWQAAKAREMARLRPLFTRGLREVSGALEASLQPAVAADRPASAAGSGSAALAASDAAMQELLVKAFAAACSCMQRICDPICCTLSAVSSWQELRCHLYDWHNKASLASSGHGIAT